MQKKNQMAKPANINSLRFRNQSKIAHNHSIMVEASFRTELQDLVLSKMDKKYLNKKRKSSMLQLIDSAIQCNQKNKMHFLSQKTEENNILEKVLASPTLHHQNALKLQRYISGGYPQDDFSDCLSLACFNKAKQQFQILNEIYQKVLKYYLQNKVEERQLSTHTMLAVVYLNENIGKLPKLEIQYLLNRLKIVL